MSKKIEKHWVIGLEKLDIHLLSPDNIRITLDYPEKATGLLPGTILAIEMTPLQARRWSQVLSRKADEALALSTLH